MYLSYLMCVYQGNVEFENPAYNWWYLFSSLNIYKDEVRFIETLDMVDIKVSISHGYTIWNSKAAYCKYILFAQSLVSLYIFFKFINILFRRTHP